MTPEQWAALSPQQQAQHAAQYGPPPAHYHGAVPGAVAAPPRAPYPPPKKSRKGLWIGLGVVGLLVVIGTANGGGKSSPATSSNAAAAPPAADTSGSGSTYGAVAAKYGGIVDVGGLTVSAEKPKAITEAYLGTQWCARVTYINKGSDSESYNLFDWDLQTKNGTETSASIPFSAGDDALNSGQLTSGGHVSGLICGDSHTKDVVAIVYKPGFGVMHQVTFS